MLLSVCLLQPQLSRIQETHCISSTLITWLGRFKSAEEADTSKQDTQSLKSKAETSDSGLDLAAQRRALAMHTKLCPCQRVRFDVQHFKAFTVTNMRSMGGSSAGTRRDRWETRRTLILRHQSSGDLADGQRPQRASPCSRSHRGTLLSAQGFHARGIGELIQLRPPHFYASGTPHKLFVGFRPILILHAFDTRKSTFLGAPEWKAEPFRRVVEDPLQALLSEACAIPAIFEMLDHSNDDSESAARIAAIQFVEAISRLDFWHKSANMTMRDFARLQKASPADTTGLEFPNITVANSLSHYWAFWIICAIQIQRLTAHHPNISQDCLLIDGEHPAGKAVTRKVLQLASFILESTGYLMREDMKLYGTASAFFPLHIARGALEMLGGSDEVICEQLARNAEVIRQHGYEDVLLHRRTILLN
ncbi:hypothetical protein CSIM01_02518 [Colletotrichum simmondsii]|uniref:Uncharacterized protein n=1 Tax=Colletotrichum simmondsii TaxID=703756 RepID=A0A135S7S3_9PEZI|nr:hypothetical protein CSIM01_02518 [Colletotrichum simmondsii]